MLLVSGARRACTSAYDAPSGPDASSRGSMSTDDGDSNGGSAAHLGDLIEQPTRVIVRADG